MAEPYGETERIGDDVTREGDRPPSVNDAIEFADIEEGAPEDATLIDNAISGYEHTSAAADRDMSALARGALFLPDRDVRAKVVRARIRQHPSAQNASEHHLDNVADRIIQACFEEVERPSEILEHDVYIAVLRNLEHLNNHDLERIAETLGYDKDHFKLKSKE